MSNIIKHIHIEKLFGTINIDWELNPDVNVLVGKNGSGKSTILRIIQTIISTSNLNSTDKELFDEGSILFTDLTENKILDLVPLIEEKLTTEKEEKPINLTKELATLAGGASLLGILGALNPIGVGIGAGIGIISVLLSEYPSKDIKENRYLVEQAKKNINIEFISTINMSANSINNLTTSSGQHTNLLDIEINNEVLRLLAFDNKETLKNNVLSALNNLFLETNKIIEFNNNKLVVKLTDGTQIDFNQLSSGERQVIFIFLKVVIASVDGALILMDEPEISLHLSWQEKLLNEIRKINTTSQIIIVTHSPAMLMNGWMDSFVDIENIMTEVSTSEEEEQ